MLIRFVLVCEACDDRFMARIEVLPSPSTRFAFPCPTCKYPVRGRYSGHSPTETNFQWDNCEIRPDDPAQTTVHSQLPIVTVGTGVPLLRSATKLSQLGGGSNYTFGTLIGKNVWAYNYHERLHRLSKAWIRYDSLLHFYLVKDWTRFEYLCTELEIGVGEWDSPMGDNTRHIFAFRPAQVLLTPLLPGDHGRLMFEDFYGAVQIIVQNSKFISWANACAESGALEHTHRQLFDALQSFVKNWSSWSSGIIARATEAEQLPLLARLHLARDEFSILRDLYVLIYERCCHALPVVMAVLNTQARGEPDTFGPVPKNIINSNSRAKPPTSIRAYEKLPNAIKMEWFDEWPAWSHYLPSILNRNVRNAIGHGDVEHDIFTGRVTSGKVDMSYVEFSACVMDLGHVLMTILQILKTTRLALNDSKDPNYSPT